MKKVNISNQCRKELKVIRKKLGYGTYSQTISFLIDCYQVNKAKQDFDQYINDLFGV